MFSFLFEEPYEIRKVARFTHEDLIVDTCKTISAKKPFETAVQHPKYNKGRWVIVEEYRTKEQAQKGHDEWVKKLSQELPEKLEDVSSFWASEWARGK